MKIPDEFIDFMASIFDVNIWNRFDIFLDFKWEIYKSFYLTKQ